MSLARRLLRSTKAKIALAVLLGTIAFQIWLSLAAPGKIAAGIEEDRRRVDVLVTLAFPPERFHIQKLQEHGRVSGTTGNSVQVRGVNRAALTSLARPYWVVEVGPLEQGG
ncbi:MAG TPA: hypothetical protein VKY54_06355 [Kiloniellales bacterium]|nr:hypothetical protein [Kiloniellales bacterium]